MPWKVSSVMEEKVRFVFEYEQDERTMTEQAVVELRQAHMRWGPRKLKRVALASRRLSRERPRSRRSPYNQR